MDRKAFFARACVVGLLFATGLAHAQQRGATKFGVYADDDGTLVLSPAVTVSGTPVEGATVGASYLADIVSASSTDLVSAATKHFEERRDDVSGNLSYTTRSYLTLGGAFDWSRETDYRSYTPSAFVAKELFDRNLTLSAAYAVSLNTVGRSGDPGFSEAMTNHSVTLSGSQVLSPDTVLGLTWQGQFARGFQASVYRYASVYQLGSLAFQTPEVVPDARDRHAAAVNLHHHLTGPIYLHGDYRLYLDDWGLLGHTVSGQLFYEISKDLFVRFGERAHWQTGADFYARRYETRLRYMTSDKELSPLWSVTTGVKIDYLWRSGAGALLSGLGINAKVDFIHVSYAEFEPLDALNAWVGELGTSVTF